MISAKVISSVRAAVTARRRSRQRRDATLKPPCANFPRKPDTPLGGSSRERVHAEGSKRSSDRLPHFNTPLTRDFRSLNPGLLRVTESFDTNCRDVSGKSLRSHRSLRPRREGFVLSSLIPRGMRGMRGRTLRPRNGRIRSGRRTGRRRRLRYSS